MEVRAVSKYVRLSVLKARDVAREIQGLPVSQALNILNFTPRKAAFLFGKTLKSAVANAEHNFELSADSLYLKTAVAQIGPALSRFKPMARGSAGPIRKPTCHLVIVLSDGNDAPAPEKPSKTNSKAKAEPAEATDKVSAKTEKKPAAKKAPAKKAAKKSE